MKYHLLLNQGIIMFLHTHSNLSARARLGCLSIVIFSICNNSVGAMKRSHDQAFEAETTSSCSSTSSSATISSSSQTSEAKEPKTIELSLNPRLVHDHELRTFNSISEACKAYGIEQEYSGGHPVSDEIAMYSLKTEIDSIKDENLKTQLKKNIRKYTKIAEVWSYALCPFYDYKIKETNEGDFSIAQEFMEIAGQQRFGNDLVRIVIGNYAYKLNEQRAPRFFEALKRTLQKNNTSLEEMVYNSGFKELTFKLGLGGEINYAYGVVNIGFLLAQHLTNDELIWVIMHELAHAEFNHDLIVGLLRYNSEDKVYKLDIDEIRRMFEREADSRALEFFKKSEAMITALFKVEAISEKITNKTVHLFRNGNSDNLIKHAKLHAYLWFPDTPSRSSIDSLIIDQIETFITLCNNSPGTKIKDLVHPTCFERICYALSQKKLQDKQGAGEQQ